MRNPLGPSYEPKVRKPYTISKQREKWTDEEHQKFLDALKLYGRTWRQIQEFVGTKTAVQIRSHAQKFFSKVVQGGNDNIESHSHVADIEIPPPRPKRKPAHPYPRKYVDPQNLIASPSFQPEKRICSNSMDSNSETRSPDSVLSAAMTQTLELPVSELPDSCLSNSSCSTGTQSGNLFSVDREDNPNATNGSASSTVDNSANMHNRSSSERETDLPKATIMLFGQIVSTNDSKKTSTDWSKTSVPSEMHFAFRADNKCEKLEEPPSSNLTDEQMSQALYYSNWTSWSSILDMNSDSTYASMQWIPIPLYTGIPPPYLISYSHNNASPSMGESTIVQKGRSSSIQNDSTEETNEALYASSSKRINKSGFMPYKRCSASTQVPIVSAKPNAEEDDAQRVRLCL